MLFTEIIIIIGRENIFFKFFRNLIVQNLLRTWHFSNTNFASSKKSEFIAQYDNLARTRCI